MKLFTLILTLTVSACGSETDAPIPGMPDAGDGDICTIENAITSDECLVGPAGPQGDMGPTGSQGPAGDLGPAGPQGQPGPQGDRGSQGLVGPAGPAGATGPAGVTGSQGSPGPQGPQGLVGATGATGPQGPQGDPGVNSGRLYLFNSSGGELGYPLYIEDGLAFYAHRDFPAPTFPQGYIVSGNLIGSVWYESQNCTGPSYIEKGSAFNVLYNLQNSPGPDYYETSGAYSSRTVRSRDGGNFCVNTGTLTVSGRVATKTLFTVDIDTPWTVSRF